jgi:pimeloyl-ACP methyl ester carboxylesterase
LVKPVRYILVHGSCHGAWCWRDVLPKLENAVAIDLPSHGEDTTPIFEVTLESYVEAIIYEINKSLEPVVLVGHSAAGFAISLIAERMPERVSHLIFLCAYVPKDGDALNVMRKRAKRQLIMPAVRMSKDRLSYTIDPIKAPSIFYHDCPAAAVDYAISHLGPQPVLPQQTPVKLGVNYDSVPRSYILCENDHTVPPEEQENFVADWPENDVYRLDCGHSPFFSQPESLVGLLGVITREIS